MYAAAYRHYQRIQQSLETDTEYLELNHIFQSYEEKYREAIQSLSPQQRQIIAAYIRICAEMTERIVEIACFCVDAE